MIRAGSGCAAARTDGVFIRTPLGVALRSQLGLQPEKDGCKAMMGDNRRLLAAQNANLSELEVNIVKGEDIMPGSKKKWNEAFEKRFNDIRNIREGGVVPDKGLKEKPKLPSKHH